MRFLSYIRSHQDCIFTLEQQREFIGLVDIEIIDNSLSDSMDRQVVSKLLVELMNTECCLVLASRKCWSNDEHICKYYEMIFHLVGVKVIYRDNYYNEVIDKNSYGFIINSPEIKRAIVAKMLLNGRINRAKHGKVASGSPPLGYKAVDGENGKDYVIDLNEARIVIKCCEIYLDEGSIGKSLFRIEQETGKRLSRQKLHDILTDSIYVGNLCYREVSISRPDLRIVDEKLRMKVLERLGRNRTSNTQSFRVRGIR